MTEIERVKEKGEGIIIEETITEKEGVWILAIWTLNQFSREYYKFGSWVESEVAGLFVYTDI